MTLDDHVACGYHEILLHDMGEEDLVIDMLLFRRVGSPLCHRYQLISRTGSHAAFRGTYLNRLRLFIEEADDAVRRRLHRQATQSRSAMVVKATDNPASGPLQAPVGHKIVSRARRPRRLKGVTTVAGGRILVDALLRRCLPYMH